MRGPSRRCQSHGLILGRSTEPLHFKTLADSTASPSPGIHKVHPLGLWPLRTMNRAGVLEEDRATGRYAAPGVVARVEACVVADVRPVRPRRRVRDASVQQVSAGRLGERRVQFGWPGVVRPDLSKRPAAKGARRGAPARPKARLRARCPSAPHSASDAGGRLGRAIGVAPWLGGGNTSLEGREVAPLKSREPSAPSELM